MSWEIKIFLALEALIENFQTQVYLEIPTISNSRRVIKRINHFTIFILTTYSRLLHYSKRLTYIFIQLFSFSVRSFRRWKIISILTDNWNNFIPRLRPFHFPKRNKTYVLMIREYQKGH